MASALSQPLEEDGGSLEEELELLLKGSPVKQDSADDMNKESDNKILEDTLVLLEDLNIEASAICQPSTSSSPTKTSLYSP